MLSGDDVLAFCELSEEEIEIIACEMALPIVVAVPLAHELFQRPDGPGAIRGLIGARLTAARRRGNGPEVRRLEQVLQAFERRCGGAGRPGTVSGGH